jgi:hypothetical protein
MLGLVGVLMAAGTALGETVVESGDDDQTTVRITVYNNGLGLVKDTRRIEIPVGQGQLRFMDVATHIMPASVFVTSLNAPAELGIVEQSYEYDLLSPERLLDRYVGRKIKLVEWNAFQDRKDEVEAVLLSNHQGPIYQIGNDIFLGHPGYRVLPELPSDLVSRPTLAWLFENRSAGEHDLEVSYLTKNIIWTADYVLTLTEDDTHGDLSGWVTLDNRSGASYRNALVKLVAGEVQRVEAQAKPELYAARAMQMKSAPALEEKGFFEYHAYDLKRKTTIADKQTKQVRLIQTSRVRAQKKLLVRGQRHYLTQRFQEHVPRQPVGVYVVLTNAPADNLGIPLPAGVVRVYQRDESGSPQFVGEDRIDHIPREEEITLKVGEAFDVVTERRQTDYRKISSRLHESEWEIRLRNHKEQEIKVGVLEPLMGNWKVIANSHKYTKADAFSIRFDVDVPSDGEVKIVYRVRVGL